MRDDRAYDMASIHASINPSILSSFHPLIVLLQVKPSREEKRKSQLSQKQKKKSFSLVSLLSFFFFLSSIEFVVLHVCLMSSTDYVNVRSITA